MFRAPFPDINRTEITRRCVGLTPSRAGERIDPGMTATAPENDRTPLPLNDRLLTIEQLSEFLSVSVKTIYAWNLDAETAPPHLRIGKRLYYPLSWVLAWAVERGA